MMFSFILRVVMVLSIVDLSTQMGFYNVDECLTGRFVDAQSWIHANGTLKKLNPKIAVDLSGQPDNIKQIFDIDADEWQNSMKMRNGSGFGSKFENISDWMMEVQLNAKEYIIFPAGIDPQEIKYMSLALNNLTGIPLASPSKHTEKGQRNKDAPWKNLQYLSLYGNNFGKRRYPAEAAKSEKKGSYSLTINATSWREIVLENDALFYYPEKTTWADELASIDLSGLLELDLRNCSIETLHNDTFTSAPRLQKLYLSHNSIFQIYASAFNAMSSLVHLDLSRNSILKTGANETLLIEGMTILRGAFLPLVSLRTLDFSFTRIVQTCATVFAQLNRSMEMLSLCYTGFPYIHKEMFSNTRMKYLDISGNIALEDLSSDAFNGIEDTLAILYAKRLGIQNVESVRNLNKLEVLALNDNDINSLDGSILENLQKLKILDLANNRVSGWNSPIFFNMPQLDLLILSKNGLSLLSMKMLYDMNNIKFLSFASNSLVCTCILRHVMDRVIENENLHVNFPKKYPIWFQKRGVHKNSTFQSAYRYYSMLIMNGSLQLMPFKNSYTDNNIGNGNLLLTSDKNIRAIDKLLKNVATSFFSRGFPKNYSFMAIDGVVDLPPPDEVFNFTFRLFDYSENNYKCTDSKSNAPWTFDSIEECGSIDLNDKPEVQPMTTISDIVMILAIVSAILIGCMVLVWKWWYVRYFFMMMKNAAMLSILGKEATHIINDNEYTYDVFVSYCEDDRSWVLEGLLPEIEHNASISVCLHERDFQVGLSILENIISCMDRSRALLMVVSNQFLMSQWCQFEMHLAQHRLLETRREQLILVLLEDIPRRRRPNTLHYLMMTKTYIVWPKMADEKAAFWKRLKKSIMYGKNTTLDRGTSSA